MKFIVLKEISNEIVEEAKKLIEKNKELRENPVKEKQQNVSIDAVSSGVQQILTQAANKGTRVYTSGGAWGGGFGDRFFGRMFDDVGFSNFQ